MKWVLLIALSASYLVDQRIQDVDIAQVDSSDDAIWLRPDGPDGLVLHRLPRPGSERGSVLILATADMGPNASTHAVGARMQLPFHGWHTYFARVPAVNESDAQAVHEVVLSYAKLIGGKNPGPLVLIAEGGIGEVCVGSLHALDVDGLVLINLPTDAVPRDLLQAVTLPSLVLQESPNHWPEEQPLGPDVELHLLSRVDARRRDNRLLRKIRGWFKRRFDAA